MSLDSFFRPKSVAIVGASRQVGKVGFEILSNMISDGYEGKIFPVNPKVESIQDLKCFPDLKSIGEVAELVIIIIPARFVAGVMEECVRVGAKAAIIITAGFKEVGDEGRKHIVIFAESDALDIELAFWMMDARPAAVKLANRTRRFDARSTLTARDT